MRKHLVFVFLWHLLRVSWIGIATGVVMWLFLWLTCPDLPIIKGWWGILFMVLPFTVYGLVCGLKVAIYIVRVTIHNERWISCPPPKRYGNIKKTEYPKNRESEGTRD